MNTNKINRNDPCPCGSGKKYKQCCQAILSTQQSIPNGRLLDDIPNLFKKAVNYQQLNQFDKAEALYLQILTLSPKQVDCLSNLALLYQNTDRAELAVPLFRKVVRIEPSSKNYGNLGQVLSGEEAIEVTKKAVSLNPGDILLIQNLGILLAKVHRHDEAITCFEKILSLSPRNDKAMSNIGNSLIYQSRHAEAASYLRQAIAINPNDELAYKRLLFCLCFDSSAFPKTYLQEAHRLEELWKKHSTPYQQWKCIKPDVNQPLRVGLVSSDIGNHPVGYFLESFINEINKSTIEFYVYSTRVKSKHDELTMRIMPHIKSWETITQLTDQQAAALIHDDSIHILIDLAGYTANTGISIFTWKPAPVQVSWLGYFASTGLSCMDYFIGDPISIPIQNQDHFTEKVCYLPHTRLCFTPPSPDIAQEIMPPPFLKNGFITFGCFQNLSKINDDTLEKWSKILHSCPNSKLLLKNNQLQDDVVKNDLLTRVKRLGIPTQSILLEAGSPRAEYLESYSKVDFMLDTFPFPGGTTTCEALWMGVPTLTLAGNTLLERQGMAMLSCVGLDDWIADNAEDYVQKAIHFGQKTDDLVSLRNSLRSIMALSPLVDAPRFAHDLEQAFQKMWHEKMD